MTLITNMDDDALFGKRLKAVAAETAIPDGDEVMDPKIKMRAKIAMAAAARWARCKAAAKFSTKSMNTLPPILPKTGMGLKSDTVSLLTPDPRSRVVITTIQAAIDDALASFETSRQKCLVVGQMLWDVRRRIPHGEFQDYIERNFHKLEYRTAKRWIDAAEQIVKFLPPPVALDIDVSVLLTTDSTKLSKENQKYKQMLLDLNANTTLKDAANGVFNEGDEAHRITRAVNGKTKGGAGNVDRKDFPTFIGKKLSDLTTHLHGYQKFTAPQLERTELLFKQNLAKWPSPVLEMLAKQLREELKTR